MLQSHNSLVLLFLISIVAFLNCDKSDNPQEQIYDCTFVQNDDDKDGMIDEVERAIMDDCRENAFTIKTDIESNLIGEWIISGHGEGWVHTVSQPCAHMTISQDSITLDFQSGYVDTITYHTWEIAENNSGNNYLSTEPNLIFFTTLNVFCDEYMYGDGTPYDGNMYLFEKVK